MSVLSSERQPPPTARGGVTSPGDAPTSAVGRRLVPGHDRGTVLVVEDDGKFARLVVRAFARAGVTSTHTDNGDAALRIAQSDAALMAVVLDVMIPHPDGIEVCHHLHRDVPHLPVVLMSARSGRDQQARGRAAGAQAFLTKPFPLQQLVRLTCGLVDAQVLAPSEHS